MRRQAFGRLPASDAPADFAAALLSDRSKSRLFLDPHLRATFEAIERGYSGLLRSAQVCSGLLRSRPQLPYLGRHHMLDVLDLSGADPLRQQHEDCPRNALDRDE